MYLACVKCYVCIGFQEPVKQLSLQKNTIFLNGNKNNKTKNITGS
jgi:hypothetical protein